MTAHPHVVIVTTAADHAALVIMTEVKVVAVIAQPQPLQPHKPEFPFNL